MENIEKMTSASAITRQLTHSVGGLIRDWRVQRRLSQLTLALEADISTRHLSCLERGKALPSRDMLGRLSDALDIPLRDRNTLLQSAGYSPTYTQAGLSSDELAPMRRAIELILQKHEPYPAFLLDRYWNILMANEAAQKVNKFIMGGRASCHTNMIRQFFDPDDLRSVVVNWEEVASNLLKHLQDELRASPMDRIAIDLVEEVLAFPGVPKQWRKRSLESSSSPVLSVSMKCRGVELRFFSTIATFGTARDITLDDLRIECAFPSNDETAALCRSLT
jgi:transcriptional regulator with XRE-family HTH domain